MEIEKSLYECLPKVANIIYLHQRSITRLIDDMRTVKYDGDIDLKNDDLDSVNTLSNESKTTLLTAYDLFLELCSLYNLRANTQSIVTAIEAAKATSIGDYVEPKLNTRQIARTEAKSAPAIPEYEFQ